MTKHLVVLVFLTLILAGCSLVSKEPSVETISPQELKTKLENKETFIFVVGNKDNCGPCEGYLDGSLRTLHKKEEYKAFYLNVDTISKQKDMDILIEVLYEYLSEDVTKTLAVPSTYFVNQGSPVVKENGQVSYDILEKHYKQYIK